MKNHRHAILSAAALLTLAVPAAAQTPPPPATHPAAPCSAAEYRQFDFWVGQWTVVGPNGAPAGTNNITLELGNCALHEHWQGAGGSKGESFNMWENTTKLWHQMWVSDQGGSLVLTGGLDGGRMIMQARVPSATPGVMTINRITWTKIDADHVRQLWDVSQDDGKTWQVSFDGLYTRRQS